MVTCINSDVFILKIYKIKWFKSVLKSKTTRLLMFVALKHFPSTVASVDDHELKSNVIINQSV